MDAEVPRAVCACLARRDGAGSGAVRMRARAFLLAACLSLATGSAFAWSNHAMVTYRALENMREVANAAPVTVEPLEAFLKAEEGVIEPLLASQVAWARANMEGYPARPDALLFKANA